MNILKRELRAQLKTFVFWSIGMFLLCFIGIIKYQSYNTAGDMMELILAFPRIVLAVMGIVGVDISTLSGYTALLFYYVLICAVIYAVHLGSTAVTRESIDKTYEFIFTKPCSRARVLAMKLTAAYVYLLLFCSLNAVFSLLAVDYLKTGEDVTGLVILLTLSVFVIGVLFVALAAFFSALAQRPEKGSLYGNLAFLYAFILGVIYNMLEKPGLLRLIAPFNYFTPAELIQGRLDPIYAALALIFTGALLTGAFRAFNKKDMV